MTETRHTQTGYAPVNNGRHWYEAAGTGHPLVLLHGGLVDSGLWEPQFPVFAQHFRTIRYDLRGHGRSSDAGPGPFSHIEDLHTLLGVLEIARAHILGLSMSGAIVVDFALAHREMVTVLLPVAAGLSGYEPRVEPAPEIEQRFAEEEALERGAVDEAVEISLQLWTDGAERTPEQVNTTVRVRVRQMTTALYTRSVRQTACASNGQPRPGSARSRFRRSSSSVIGISPTSGRWQTRWLRASPARARQSSRIPPTI